MTKVKCPHCGYVMAIEVDASAECHGVVVRCKGRHCKKTFEIKIKAGKQVEMIK